MGENFSFSKTERLSGEMVINDLFLKGASIMSYPIRVVWLVTENVQEAGVQVLMSVPKKKLKHAVDRNRVKRLLREAYRLNKSELTELVIHNGWQLRMAFVWIPNEVLEYGKVQKKVVEALFKLQNQLMIPIEQA